MIMLAFTTTKKRTLQLVMVALALLCGIAIGVTAILNAINAAADEPLLPVYCVDRGDNKIALTFDCAWGNSNTDRLLEILDNAGAKATFFVTGEFCDKYPDDVKKFADSGHEIGNHSDKHPHVAGMNITDLIADTKACENKIVKITGKKPTLYRGPYGEYDDNMLTTVKGMGYEAVQWSADSIDWQEPDAPTICKRIMDNTESGSILLFHNDLENTTAALPEILLKLKQQGMDFVTVSELIYHDSYHIDHTGKQIYDVNVSESAFISYTADSYANQALATAAEALSPEELDALSQGDVTVLSKVLPLLSEEQVKALSEIPAEQLAEICSRISAKETAAEAGSEAIEAAAEVPAEALEYPPLYIGEKENTDVKGAQ